MHSSYFLVGLTASRNTKYNILQKNLNLPSTADNSTARSNNPSKSFTRKTEFLDIG